jgi:DGQHR domain-containing protein
MPKRAEKDLCLPALEIRQGERTLYQFAVEGELVADISTVSRVHRDEGGEIGGYQRPEVQRHVKAIRTYLESPGALMPNALVIAFDSRVTFKAANGVRETGNVRAGTLIIPHSDQMSLQEDRPGWIVDGQQRAAALREARLKNFLIPVIAFITDDLREQRAQFILVNNTKPLPKGLIHELLPVTNAHLPIALLRKRYPSKLLSLLNLLPKSPMEHAIKTPTMPDGRIRDNSVMKMIENSITDGALYRYRDPRTGEGDTSEMLKVLWNFWGAVAQTWPEAWALPPRKSRLTHGVGIVALGYVMDEITDRCSEGSKVPPVETYVEHLAPLVRICAWTRGRWDFGDREYRPWNELQVTPKDILKLTELLLQHYRSANIGARARGSRTQAVVSA